MWFKYAQGFFIKDRLIRILDVASGTYLHDIHMAKFSWITSIRVNSNYVVINGGKCLHVYSLQALKNPPPSDAFVFKTNLIYDELFGVLVDETQIFCLDVKYFNFSARQITVFDFGSFDLKTIPTLAEP